MNTSRSLSFFLVLIRTWSLSFDRPDAMVSFAFMQEFLEMIT